MIKHLVVIYQENRAFDHYFGTYPVAENKPCETPFYARKGTPPVQNYITEPVYLSHNQNLAQPFRLGPTEANTCNPGHKYTQLQASADSMLMDKYVENSGQSCSPPSSVMGYFDGNTVTALWNYAQYFSMSDNFHSTILGPSVPGNINLVSGQTHGAKGHGPGPYNIIDGTLINNHDPFYDKCSAPTTVSFSGVNIGNLLNAKGITWGAFLGGFAGDCTATSMGPNGPVFDYSSVNNWFQYYQSTSNPEHLPPTSPEMVGKTDQANHNYDLTDFWAAAAIGNVPAVSFFKALGNQNGHPGDSTPLLEQEFLVSTLNRLQTLPQWKDMAVIITYDDSGGFYDHVPFPIINDSQTTADVLTAPGQAGTRLPMGGYQGRPGYGARLPFILISPWAKDNFVDHTLTDQTSILRFIEDNWCLGRIGDYSYDALAGSLLNMFDFTKRKLRYLFLNPATGEIECYKRKWFISKQL